MNVTIPDRNEHLSGGDATVFVNNNDAFSQRPLAVAKNFALDGAFTSGDHFFRTPMAGVGPLLNTNNCQGCHLNDGRGVLPSSPSEPFTSALVKIGSKNGAPDPVYGDQIQTFSVTGFSSSDIAIGLPKYDAGLKGELKGEAFPYIEYEEIAGQYSDGTYYSLRKPIYKFKDMSFGDFIQDIQFSVRVAPQVFGSGLLEAIPEAHLRALADPNDEDNNGISGKLSLVTEELTQTQTIGRFAYKAQSPSVLQQVAAAFNGDSGLTSSIFPKEPCTDQQQTCLDYASKEPRHGGSPDLDNVILAFVEFYNRVLAVPARRGYGEKTKRWDDNILAGRKVFMDINCQSCHTPRHQTGNAKGSVLGEITLSGLSENASDIHVLSNQTIYPFTDLLLHDMGGTCQVSRETPDNQLCTSGENCHYVQRCEGLADGLVQGNALQSEWKTPALWGLGLVQTVNPKATFLHDGRARTIEEAILWHGGEATSSQREFIALNAKQRQDLIAFLTSL